ncbi:wd repeat and hmg-box dna-binding protein 1 [Limosa lapponica baueri]|uniref:Wd repeat and hmg-box dna-binding protein 1 n=1 Tax=Limosa lapponica baueri TaxID=1758121 RepID=A0A2I0T4S9_LIMLA|nr:wd repeat and hmg-box dna-binding protein 1 [Limosa lapponica baueri]
MGGRPFSSSVVTNPVSFHSCIVTCGSDGDVRIWENLDDDDPKSINVGEKAYSCALKNGRLITAVSNNTIQIHTFPEGAPDGILTRFTMNANHVIFNSDGSKIAAGSRLECFQLLVLQCINVRISRTDLTAASSILLPCAKENVLTLQDHGAADVYSHAKVRGVLICPRASSRSLASESSPFCQMITDDSGKTCLRGIKCVV